MYIFIGVAFSLTTLFLGCKTSSPSSVEALRNGAVPGPGVLKVRELFKNAKTINDSRFIKPNNRWSCLEYSSVSRDGYPMTVVFKNAQSGKELYRYAFMREAGETPDFAVFKASTGDQDEHIYLGKIGAGGGAVEPADREQVRKSGISIEIRTFRETYLSGIKHIVVESTETIDQSDASLYFRETSPISIIAKQWIKTAGVFSYWDCKEL